MNLAKRMFFLKKAVFTVVAVFFFVVLIELGFRVAGYEPLKSSSKTDELYQDVLRYFVISDPQLGFKNRPNGQFVSQAIKIKPLITTDRHGFRNGFGWSENAQNPMVVFIGDSVTFCAEVNDNETGPSEVAKLLAGEDDVTVLNAAVQAYNTLQSKRMLEAILNKFKTIKVAVYVYCENDLYENLSTGRDLSRPTMQWDKDENSFKTSEVPADPLRPWGSNLHSPEVMEKRNHRGQPIRIKITNVLRSHSAFVNRILILLRTLVSGSQKEEAIVASARDNGGDLVIEELLRQMNKLCVERGVAFLATAFTRQNDDANFKDRCQNAGVQFVGIGRFFVDHSLSYASLRIDGQYDGHYGPEGTKAFAQGISPAIRAILDNEKDR